MVNDRDDFANSLKHVGEEWTGIEKDAQFQKLPAQQQSEYRHFYWTNRVMQMPGMAKGFQTNPELAGQLHKSFFANETAQMDAKTAPLNEPLYSQPLTRGLGLDANTVENPYARGAAKFAEGLTTPVNLGLLVGTAGLGPLAAGAGKLAGVAPQVISQGSRVIGGLVSAGFTVDMLHGLYQQGGQFKEALDKAHEAEFSGDEAALKHWQDTTKEIGTQMVLGGGMAGLAGRHAFVEGRSGIIGNPMPHEVKGLGKLGYSSDQINKMALPEIEDALKNSIRAPEESLPVKTVESKPTPNHRVRTRSREPLPATPPAETEAPAPETPKSPLETPQAIPPTPAPPSPSPTPQAAPEARETAIPRTIEPLEKQKGPEVLPPEPEMKKGEITPEAKTAYSIDQFTKADQRVRELEWSIKHGRYDGAELTKAQSTLEAYKTSADESYRRWAMNAPKEDVENTLSGIAGQIQDTQKRANVLANVAKGLLVDKYSLDARVKNRDVITPAMRKTLGIGKIPPIPKEFIDGLSDELKEADEGTKKRLWAGKYLADQADKLDSSTQPLIDRYEFARKQRGANVPEPPQRLPKVATEEMKAAPKFDEASIKTATFASKKEADAAGASVYGGGKYTSRSKTDVTGKTTFTVEPLKAVEPKPEAKKAAPVQEPVKVTATPVEAPKATPTPKQSAAASKPANVIKALAGEVYTRLKTGKGIPPEDLPLLEKALGMKLTGRPNSEIMRDLEPAIPKAKPRTKGSKAKSPTPTVTTYEDLLANDVPQQQPTSKTAQLASEPSAVPSPTPAKATGEPVREATQARTSPEGKVSPSLQPISEKVKAESTKALNQKAAEQISSVKPQTKVPEVGLNAINAAIADMRNKTGLDTKTALKLREAALQKYKKGLAAQDPLALAKVLETIKGSTPKANPAISGSGRLNTSQEPDELGFVSPLYNIASLKLPAKGTTEQMLKTLENNGASKEELKFTGTDSFLKSGRVVTKGEVLSHIQDNKVKLREIIKGKSYQTTEQRELARLNVELDSLYNKHASLFNSMLDSTHDPDKQQALHRATADITIGISEHRDNLVTEGLSRIREHFGADKAAEVEEINNNLLRANARLAELDNQRVRPSESTAQYESYTLPGGSNYREVLYQLPYRPELSERDASGFQGRDKVAEHSNYHSPHFDEPNILAHGRFKDRIDADGKKVLFLEEAQSDWHHAGERHGYRDEGYEKRMDDLSHQVVENNKQYTAAHDELNTVIKEVAASRKLPSSTEGNMYVNEDPINKAKHLLRHLDTKYTEEGDVVAFAQGNRIRQAQGRLEGLMKQERELTTAFDRMRRDAVPPAPFRSNWHEVVMKRALRMAAEGGYDKLAWTTGKQQAERYSLSKVADQLEYIPTNEVQGHLVGYKDGHEAFRQPADISKNSASNNPTLHDLVGKDVADRLLANKMTDFDGKRSYGLKLDKEIDVGGPSHKALYDKMIPQFMEKYGRKYGVKVGETDLAIPTDPKGDSVFEIRTPDGELHEVHGDRAYAEQYAQRFNATIEKDISTSSTPVHSVDITPDLRKRLTSKGQEPFGSAAAMPVGRGKEPSWKPLAREVADQLAERAKTRMPDGITWIGHDAEMGLGFFNEPNGSTLAMPLGQIHSKEAVLAHIEDWKRQTGQLAKGDFAGALQTFMQAIPYRMAKFVHDYTPGPVRNALMMSGNRALSIYAEHTDMRMDEAMDKLGASGSAATHRSYLSYDPFRNYKYGVGGAYFRETKLATTRVAGILERTFNSVVGNKTMNEVKAHEVGHAILDRMSVIGPELKKVGSYYKNAVNDIEARYKLAGQPLKRGSEDWTDEAFANSFQHWYMGHEGDAVGFEKILRRNPEVWEAVRGLKGAGADFKPGQQPTMNEIAFGFMAGEPHNGLPFVNPISALQRVVAPQGLSGGDRMEQIIRQRTGELRRSKDQLYHDLDDAIKRYNSYGPTEMAHWTDAVETGNFQALAMQDRPVAMKLRQMLDERRDAIHDLGGGKFDNYIENYFPHIWADPTKASTVIGKFLGSKRPLAPSSFLKKRSIDLMSEGLQNGLEPVTYNPAKMALLRLHEMDRYLAAHKMLADGKASGIVRWIKGSQLADARSMGYVELNDRIFNPRFKVTPEGQTGKVLASSGLYMAPKDVAEPINNYLSPGLRGSKVYDKLRTYGNALNQVQLGMSFFHAAFVSMDASISDMALGFNKAFHGDFTGASQNLVRGLIPFASVVHATRIGNMLKGEWLEPGKYPHLTGLANAYEMAGGAVGQDPYYLTGAGEKFRRFKAQGDYFKMAFQAPLTAMEMLSKPVLEQLVPRVKLGVFAEMAKHEISTMTEQGVSDPAAILHRLDKVADSVDNRLGQLVYDNLFLNKVKKDLGMLSIRSLGWNIGTIREIGGGLKDTAIQAGRLVSGKKSQIEMTHRMAYTLALPIVTGAVGAIMNMAFTGQPPQSPSDYYFPRTGNLAPGGKEERVSLPSYMRDVWAVSHAPGTTVVHKLHPMFGQLYDMYNNQDFYGVEIRHPGDPLVQQAASTMKHFLGSWAPMSVTNALERSRSGAGILGQLSSGFGITPAPKYVGETQAEQKAYDLATREMRRGPMTTEEFDRQQHVAQLRNQLEVGKITPTQLAIQLRAGQLSPNDFDRILEDYKKPPLIRHMSRLSPDSAMEVWNLATPSEKVQLRPYMAGKMDSLDQYLPEKRGYLMQEYKKALSQ